MGGACSAPDAARPGSDRSALRTHVQSGAQAVSAQSQGAMVVSRALLAGSAGEYTTRGCTYGHAGTTRLLGGLCTAGWEATIARASWPWWLFPSTGRGPEQ